MNRKLRTFSAAGLHDAERLKLVRVLRRTRKRVDAMLAAINGVGT
jgi:hypothetical protein